MTIYDVNCKAVTPEAIEDLPSFNPSNACEDVTAERLLLLFSAPDAKADIFMPGDPKNLPLFVGCEYIPERGRSKDYSFVSLPEAIEDVLLVTNFFLYPEEPVRFGWLLHELGEVGVNG